MLAAALLTGGTHAGRAQDTVRAFERPNGALLRPAALTYSLSLVKLDGQTTDLGTRTVVVSEAALGGNPGWLIADTRRGTVVETTDSVFLARGDLSPERWVATIGRAQLGASFTRDSVFGAIETYQGRASFAIGVPANAILSAGMLERIVEMLPLAAGYRASATLVLIDGATPKFLPAEIDVDRDEIVQVAGRSVDAWRVAIRSGAIEERLWVGKADARVVRTEQAWTGGVLTSELRQ